MATKQKNIRQLKEDVALSHRLLYHTGLATTRGHSSVRIPGTNRFLIKSWPHVQMNRITADDIITMDFDGNIVGTSQKVTRVSEWPIHAEIYRARPEAGAVIHTHQKWATTMALAGKTILPVVGAQFSHVVASPLPVFDEDKALIRSIQQGRLVAKALGSAPACHLQNHGMVFVGTNIETATLNAIYTEYEAEVTWRAMLIGNPKTIPIPYLQPGLQRLEAGEVEESWEHYWKWVDKHPESLYRRSTQS